jgi:hypothetical protein
MALEEAGLSPLRKYITHCVATIRQYMETCHIDQLCLVASMAVYDDRLCIRWWTQSIDNTLDEHENPQVQGFDNGLPFALEVLY